MTCRPHWVRTRASLSEEGGLTDPEDAGLTQWGRGPHWVRLRSPSLVQHVDTNCYQNTWHFETKKSTVSHLIPHWCNQYGKLDLVYLRHKPASWSYSPAPLPPPGLCVWSCLVAAGVIEGPWDLNHMEGPQVIGQSQEMQLGCKHIKLSVWSRPLFMYGGGLQNVSVKTTHTKLEKKKQCNAEPHSGPLLRASCYQSCYQSRYPPTHSWRRNSFVGSSYKKPFLKE